MRKRHTAFRIDTAVPSVPGLSETVYFYEVNELRGRLACLGGFISTIPRILICILGSTVHGCVTNCITACIVESLTLRSHVH